MKLEEETAVVGPSRKRQILKNILVISIAFTILFSYQSMSHLQSSINKQDGTIALSVIYASLIVSCFFLPTWLIKTLKAKWTMVLCVGGYTSFLAAQFYPTLYTLIPTGILLGLGASPLWSAKCTYLTQVGGVYSRITKQNQTIVLTRFFGIFFLFFQLSQVTGSLISSTVLSLDVTEVNRTEEILNLCGARFCPSVDLGNTSLLQPPKKFQIYLISSIFIVCTIVAAGTIAIFVDPLSTFIISETVESKGRFHLLVATFKHLNYPHQLLLIPLTIWSGLEQGFISSDFTASYVTCVLGVHMVGYALICFGVCAAISCYSLTWLVKFVGRVPIFTIGAALNFFINIFLMTWYPDPDQIVMFFVVAGIWGVTDGIWQTQINALYGALFSNNAEAAFSNYKLWESIGFLIAFICSSLICTDTKLYILMIFLALGMSGYYISEFFNRNPHLLSDSKGDEMTISYLLKKDVH